MTPWASPQESGLCAPRIAMRPAWAYTWSMTDCTTDTSFNNQADKPALRVIVSLDVEEEGLFSGNYAAQGCGVRNVALLRRLAPLTSELGFPLTLFCAHTVFANVSLLPSGLDARPLQCGNRRAPAPLEHTASWG